MVGVFLACTLGDLFTYCVTSFQLALAYPSEVGGVLASAAKFLGIFAVTQVPLAIIEGILSVVVVIGLETYAKPELEAISFTGGKIMKKSTLVIALFNFMCCYCSCPSCYY